MGDIVYLDGVESAFEPEPGVPVPSVVAYLEELLKLAQEGEISGIVCVSVSNGHVPGYAILGHIGGYSTIGALSCVKDHLVRAQLDGAELVDA
jgi:hypothetical protein